MKQIFKIKYEIIVNGEKRLGGTYDTLYYNEIENVHDHLTIHHFSGDNCFADLVKYLEENPLPYCHLDYSVFRNRPRAIIVGFTEYNKREIESFSFVEGVEIILPNEITFSDIQNKMNLNHYLDWINDNNVEGK